MKKSYNTVTERDLGTQLAHCPAFEKAGETADSFLMWKYNLPNVKSMTVVQIWNEHVSKILFISGINEGTSKMMRPVQRTDVAQYIH